MENKYGGLKMWRKAGEILYFETREGIMKIEVKEIKGKAVALLLRGPKSIRIHRDL